MKQLRYPVSERVLEKWMRERIYLLEGNENRYHFIFPFEGSTCNNGGVPFHTDIHAVCGVKDTKIEFERGWFGFSKTGLETAKEMCGFNQDGDAFFEILKKNPPFAGSGIAEIVTDTLPVNAAGCLCTEAMRNQKWVWVLSTIHYAFARRFDFQTI